MKIIATILNRGLALCGLRLSKISSGFWDLDSTYIALYESIKDRTLVKIDRSYMIYQFAKSVATSLRGDVAQVGVYKGGTAKIIASCFKDTESNIYLFDTFEGLPSASKHDGAKGTENNDTKKFTDVHMDDITQLFSPFSNIEIRQGLFPATATGLESKQFSFVYLDADLYQSTKDGLEFFYPRMVMGGVILLDDYNTDTWPGVEKAVREFCTEHNISPIMTTWWQGLIVKGNR